MADRRILEAAIVSRLEHQPTTPTKAIKRLRPNPLAEMPDQRLLAIQSLDRGCHLHHHGSRWLAAALDLWIYGVRWLDTALDLWIYGQQL